MQNRRILHHFKGIILIQVKFVMLRQFTRFYKYIKDQYLCKLFIITMTTKGNLTSRLGVFKTEPIR